jgi:hypothetical protein
LIVATARSGRRVSQQGAQPQIDDSRAAAILGFSRETIRRMSEELGIGHKPVPAESEAPYAGAASDTIVFTYEELHRLCRASMGAT